MKHLRAELMGSFLPVAVMRSVPLGLLATASLLAGAKLLLDVLYPFGLDYGEGVVLDGVRTVLEGRTLYPPLDDDSYLVFPYMPLYVWVCAALAWLPGLSYQVGRVLTLAATAACVGLVLHLCLQAGASRRASLVGCLLFLTSTPVVGFGAFARVDMLGLAFSLGGLATIYRGKSVLWAGLLFALAILTKQSMMAALLACCLYLAAHRRQRDLVVLLLAVAVPVVSACGWAMYSTRGWMWFHTVTAHAVRYSVIWLARWMREVPVQHGWLALMAAAGWYVSRRPGGWRRPSLLVCYVISACGATLLAGRMGAVLNFFLDYAAALSIAAAVGMSQLLAGARGERWLSLRECFVATVLVLHLGMMTVMPDLQRMLAALPALRRVTGALAQAPGPVLSDDPSLVAGAGRRLVFEPFLYTQMGRSGIWSTDALVGRLRQGAFPVIVLRFDPWDTSHRLRDGTWADGRFSDEMVAAVRHGYRVEERCNGVNLLCPRTRSAGQEP